MKQLASLIVALTVALLIAVAAMDGRPGPVVESLLTGWWRYAGGSLPRVRYDWGRIASAAVWFALFAAGFHWTARWLWRETGVRGAAGVARVWRARWTALAVELVVVMFAAGTAAVGVVHQIGYLAAAADENYEYPRRVTPGAYQGKHVPLTAQELLEAARREKLPASRILVAEVGYSTIYGFLHDHYHLVGVDGADGVVAAVLMYPRDPRELAEHGFGVAIEGRTWTERGKTPREVYGEVWRAVRTPTSRPARLPG